MSLSLYKKKRKFTKTTEPQGGKSSGNALRFVVQKHEASHLHYDFRLEMGGVLKSWAVPKGPSLDPDVKRLAMMVEDHPYDYRDFEGVIPEGNYGAGTVIIWDEGTYEPVGTGATGKKEQEKQLLSELKRKRLKFTLHGKKLGGDFALVKTHTGAENAWLLMKTRDRYATGEDITLKDRSVVSKRTLEQVGKENVTKGKAVKKKTAPAKQVKTKALTGSDAKEEVIKVKGHLLKLTNLNKLYWPREKIAKRDLLNYYTAIAPYIMPYMKNRPQSMNRHPDGIGKPSFYHKNVADTAPDWLATFPYTSENDNKTTNYLVCTNEASLLYMASQGCIEMNPWHSRVPDVDHPDWCVIDLDPDTNTFNKVIETANVIRQILDSAAVNSYCKTSGSTGLHIYIPLGAKYTYEQSRMLAQLVVQVAQAQLPSFTSIERSPAKRKGKIYLDYLQNKTAQTIAAPYSLRPKPGAPVSTPLYWEEVKKGLKIKDHNMFNIFDRLKETGDIFKPVLGKGINMKQALDKIGSLQ